MATQPADAVTVEQAAQFLGISEDEVEVRLHSHNLLPHAEQPVPDGSGTTRPWIDLASLEEAKREQHEEPKTPPGPLT
jgi:hypothetical protein